MSRHDQSNLVKVWDPAVRLFHWILVAMVATLWFSGEWGKLNLHMTLGAWALVLLLFRWLWGVAGSPTARFSQFVRGPRAIIDYVKAARTGAVRSIGHNPLGALSVLALLGLLTVQAVTGLFTSDDIFSEGPLAHLADSGTVALLSTIHRVGGKLVLILVGLHLAAVLFYTFVKKDDLLRAMFTGTKKVPAGVEGVHYANPLLAVVLLAASAAVVWGVLALYGN